MADVSEVSGWSGVLRCDGARLERDEAGVIAIVAPPGVQFPAYRLTPAGTRLAWCPCCNLPFPDSRAAQRTANALLPVAN